MRAQRLIVRHLQAVCLQYRLGQQLVHRQSAGQHSAAGVRHPEHLQHALNCAVLACTTMQGVERHVHSGIEQLPGQVRLRIKHQCIEALGLQHLQHSGTGAQRYLTFTGLTTGKDCYSFVSCQL